MKSFVVDANVAAKWFLPEIHDASALRLLDPASQLHVPDLLFAEMGNLLWKRITRSELSLKQTRDILDAVRLMPLQIWPSPPLILMAFEIAYETRRTVYDSIYVALAISLKCHLVTADVKLYQALKEGPFGSSLIWIEEI